MSTLANVLCSILAVIGGTAVGGVVVALLHSDARWFRTLYYVTKRRLSVVLVVGAFLLSVLIAWAAW